MPDRAIFLFKLFPMNLKPHLAFNSVVEKVLCFSESLLHLFFIIRALTSLLEYRLDVLLFWFLKTVEHLGCCHLFAPADKRGSERIFQLFFFLHFFFCLPVSSLNGIELLLNKKLVFTACA